jgi:hypothetical protein
MSGENEIGDYRFAGYSNQELATMVDQVRQGPGSESMNRAVDALTAIANSLKQTDEVLRTELQKLGVEWQGASGEDAQVVMTDSAQYGGSATGTINGSADAVGTQGSDFSRTRNCAPESGTLRGATDYNVVDTLLCHTTDHSKEVQQTRAARAQAVDAMDGYANSSKQNLAGYQSLPVPPSLDLVSQPIQRPSTGTSVSSFGGGSSSFTSSGSGIPVTSGAPGVPGGPIGSFDGGPGNPGGGVPGQPGGGSGGPGNPGNPGGPGGPGKLIGTGPMPGPGLGTPPGVTPPSPMLRPSFEGMGAAAVGMAGGAGGGAAVGAVSDKERLVRGGGAAGRPGGGALPGGSRGSAAGMGGLPHEEAAARTADRVGAKSKPGASMMQPAAGTAQGEEDDEHVRKYGIEAEDVFADDRMVIPSVLGEDDDE